MSLEEDACPICLDPEAPRNWAIEWDNGEPAPGSGKYGMSVCKACHDGVYRLIEPWEWVTACIVRERKLTGDLQANLRRLARQAIATLEKLS